MLDRLEPQSEKSATAEPSQLNLVNLLQPGSSDKAQDTSGNTADSNAVDKNGFPEISIAGATDIPGQTDDGTQNNEGSWTIALDLRMSFWPEIEEERPNHFVHGQLEELRELADQTAGTGVSFVVQAQHPLDEKVDAQGTSGISDDIVDRYLIADGKITELGSFHSQGMDKDTAETLRLASELAPADNVGLILNAHGHGANGLSVLADGNDMSLEQLSDAIEDGLQGSSHEQLDLLVFDGCEMGSAPVLDAMQNSADHIVASEEYTYESKKDIGNFDMINQLPVLEDLLKEPTMSAEALAQQFICEASGGANGAPVVDPENDAMDPHSGTSTLAHFDMSEYGDFEKSLQDLGQVLDGLMTDPATRKELRSVAFGSAQADADKDDSEYDLHSFVNRLEDAIKAGKLPDSDGKIAMATKQLKQDFEQLVQEYSADPGKYQDMGGLSVPFPRNVPPEIGYENYFDYAWKAVS
jgi:Clostripain family.